MEQRLYAQVVMIFWKDYDDKYEKENKNIYNFQGKTSRPIQWFDLNHERLEEVFRTHELDFYNKNYIKNNRGHDTKTYQLFLVPIGNAKITENILFHPADPVL